MARWLTWDQLLAELQIAPYVVRRLIREGKILGLSHNNSRRYHYWKFLDPATRYLEALKIQEEILAKTHKFNIMEFPIISTDEMAALAGINRATIRGLIFKKKLKPHKYGTMSLFTPAQARQFLLKRERKEPTSRRARVESLLKWCLAHVCDSEGTISKEAVDADDKLEGTLNKLLKLKEPERGVALLEFWRRYQLGKDVVVAIRQALRADANSRTRTLDSVPTPSTEHRPSL